MVKLSEQQPDMSELVMPDGGGESSISPNEVDPNDRAAPTEEQLNAFFGVSPEGALKATVPNLTELERDAHFGGNRTTGSYQPKGDFGPSEADIAKVYGTPIEKTPEELREARPSLVNKIEDISNEALVVENRPARVDLAAGMIEGVSLGSQLTKFVKQLPESEQNRRLDALVDLYDTYAQRVAVNLSQRGVDGDSVLDYSDTSPKKNEQLRQAAKAYDSYGAINRYKVAAAPEQLERGLSTIARHVAQETDVFVASTLCAEALGEMSDEVADPQLKEILYQTGEDLLAKATVQEDLTTKAQSKLAEVLVRRGAEHSVDLMLDTPEQMLVKERTKHAVASEVGRILPEQTGQRFLEEAPPTVRKEEFVSDVPPLPEEFDPKDIEKLEKRSTAYWGDEESLMPEKHREYQKIKPYLEQLASAVPQQMDDKRIEDPKYRTPPPHWAVEYSKHALHNIEQYGWPFDDPSVEVAADGEKYITFIHQLLTKAELDAKAAKEKAKNS